MAVRGDKLTLAEMTNIMLVDRLNIMIWQGSADGQKGKNKPESLLDKILNGDKKSDIVAFDSGEDWQKEWEKRTKGD